MPHGKCQGITGGTDVLAGLHWKALGITLSTALKKIKSQSMCWEERMLQQDISLLVSQKYRFLKKYNKER